MASIEKLRSKLKRESTYLARDAKHHLGLYNNFYKSARGNRIMIYHGICLEDHTRFNPIFLTLKTFEEHLKFYKKYFNVLSLNDYYEKKFSVDRFNICLTFDDGFANNYKYVLPLLEQYQIPATFFITAIRATGHDILWNDFLGIISKYGPAEIVFKNEQFKKGPFDKYISVNSGTKLIDMLRSKNFDAKAEMMEVLYPLVPFKSNKQNEDYWMQMTPDQIRALASSSLVSIGAHGHYHNDLAKINIKDTAGELSFSKKYLENIIQEPVNAFAFPYGSYNTDVVNESKKAGFKQLLAMDFQSAQDHNDLTMRERFTVNPFISTNNQMYATITRKYE
jgi:peptidoglycan/xylan/chitin deacetylase (PgdA/CDA1 family)